MEGQETKHMKANQQEQGSTNHSSGYVIVEGEN
jgi:hypothetical protein